MQNERIQFVDYYIRMSWHKLSRMYNLKAAKYDLTISMGYILLIVDHEGTPSTQLGPKMGMVSTSLSRTLKAMEDRGLIYREQAKGDFRQVLIFLTQEGVRMRKLTKNTIQEFNDLMSERISEKKLKVFYETMIEIERAVDEQLNEK